MEEFIFTPENLADNIDKLGPWSSYGLASKALEHYFPAEYEVGDVSTSREAEMVKELGLEYWEDVILKYHKEVGYSGNFDTDYVNER